MMTRKSLWTLAAAAVATLSLSAPVVADDDNANKNAQNDTAVQAKEDVMVMAHALGMSIDGCTLQSMANALPNAGNAEEHLRKHARSAFDGSERLMKFASEKVGSGRDNPKNADGQQPVVNAKAADNETPKQLARRFYIAASEYANVLQRMSTEQPNGANAAAANANGINRQNETVATVAVINHGVCEVVNAWKLRTEAEKSGNSASKSESCQRLAEHAQQMDREGRQLLSTFTQAEQKEGNGRAALPAQVQTLINRANEMIIALDGLSNNKENGNGRE